MNALKSILCMSLISLFSASATAASIVGEYNCAGVDPSNNSKYTNPMKVQKNGDSYTFQWLTDSGYPFILGTGIYNTDINAASVVFWDPKKSDYFGTLLYKVNSDGSLKATWIVQGTALIGTESCTKK